MLPADLIGALLESLRRLSSPRSAWDPGLSRADRKLLMRAAIALTGQVGELLTVFAAGEDIDEQLAALINAADDLACGLTEADRQTVAEILQGAQAPPDAELPDFPGLPPGLPWGEIMPSPGRPAPVLPWKPAKTDRSSGRPPRWGIPGDYRAGTTRIMTLTNNTRPPGVYLDAGSRVDTLSSVLSSARAVLGEA
jgi:hypothetical protein